MNINLDEALKLFTKFGEQMLELEMMHQHRMAELREKYPKEYYMLKASECRCRCRNDSSSGIGFSFLPFIGFL